jgi:WD40 repeat protein
MTLRGHQNWVYSVAFSPGSKRLATASKDNNTKIWDAETSYAVNLDDLLRLAHSRVTRGLTPEECKQYFDSGTCPKLP